jgi:hypothetical protein
MPRKQKLEKQTITVVVGGKSVSVILHPPAGPRKSWFVYWNGLVASRSTGQQKLEDAIVAAESMLRNGGKQARVSSTVLSDEEFIAIQHMHYGRKKGRGAQARAAKSLQNCLESIRAFQTISGINPIALAKPSDCATFQRTAINLPKNTLRPYPKGKKQVTNYSANTVLKWSVALQAAWERSCRTAGKRCVRGVVDDAKLLTENPWRAFTWIEGYKRPIRQFDGAELVGILDYLDEKWPGVTVASLFAKVLFWSIGRRAEISALTWSQFRIVGSERHFQVVGKWGVEKWFRIPDALHKELLTVKTQSPYVFAAYNDQLREFYKTSSHPCRAQMVGTTFNPVCLGDWFHERLGDWSCTLPNGHVYTHVFRKTSLQYARRGEDASALVARDAKVSKDVMMTHYVQERDPELREASNRTFGRLLASVPTEVAVRYGHVEVAKSNLEKYLQEAITSKNWSLAAELSAKLARQGYSATG